MAIRIERNEQGNCINFHGATNPTYWNSCLSAQVDAVEADSINVVNDIITSQTGVTQYEFYRIPYTEFVDAEGNAFADAATAAAYITEKANVVGLGGGGTELTDITVCFKLDNTSTSIMLDNGYSYGVNTIKAVDTGDGLISIKSELGDITHFTKLDHTLVCDGEGSSISGGLNDVINYLNELFTVGAFESVVISDPYSTMVADTTGVTTTEVDVAKGTAIEVAADEYGATTTSYNGGGYKTPETIDQAGEYFTFDIRNEGIMGFGLIVSDDDYADGNFNGNSTYANPSTFCNGPNSGNYGFQFSHWFHPTPNGPWTNYGANTAMSYREGWSNATWKFSGSPEGAKWLNGDVIRMRVGINENNFITVGYYDESTGLYVDITRTTYPVPNGNEFHLGIKFGDSTVRLVGLPKVHLLEPAAPTMYFRYIESPDGVYNYPLFATAEEAEYYDEIVNGLTAGTGSSHTHTYADDATNTTWYMPEASHDAATYQSSSAPDGTETFSGNTVTYTEVTSLTDADLTPSQFSSADISQEEGTNVNIQVTPAGASWSTSVTISPSGSGLVYDNYSVIQGTLADVGADTDYTVTVTRANSYGSSVGSMTITATDVAPVQTNDTPWSKALDFSGSNEHAKQVTQSNASNALRMNGLAQLAGANSDSSKTSNGTYSRPWATAVVFKVDRHSSNQHIWNSGEGAGTNADNIYLRLEASGHVYLGWGREGVGYNECKIDDITYSQTSVWFGVYIAHKGARYNSSDATAANLADAFDIRLMSSEDSFATVGSNLSTSTNWTANGIGGGTGVRMDRTVEGDFTIGGRGSNRNFQGKVASMIITTLRKNYTMPTDAEIELMITDPLKWEADYKEGQAARYGYSGSNFTYSSSNSNSKYATQIWLMGDGTSDSYSNGVRNQVEPSDQNSTKLQLNSMVSNDIETVNINGLT